VTIADYHVHTTFSIDCDVDMEQQCLAAISQGISEIAFTDHVDHDLCDAESRARYNYEAYCEAIELNRERFAGKIEILRAAEVDWNESTAEDVARFIEDHDYEFIIGSVHNLNHAYVGFSTLESMGGPRKMYDDYLDQLQGLVDTGFPDVIGHLDLPRRYHPFAMHDVDADHFEHRLREIFRLASERGVGFEINTSGVRKGLGFTLPEAQVIGWFLEEGGQVLTVGSDSHRSEDTGHSIPETYAELTRMGITWRSSYIGGELKRVALPTGLAV
jgi:histidinol-phosphatase (PHP family)